MGTGTSIGIGKRDDIKAYKTAGITISTRGENIWLFEKIKN